MTHSVGGVGIRLGFGVWINVQAAAVDAFSHREDGVVVRFRRLGWVRIELEPVSRVGFPQREEAV